LKLLRGDRLAAFALLAVAALYWLEARRFVTGFIADPVGPRAFPNVLGTVLAVSSLSLLLGHGGEERVWPSGRFWRRWGLVTAGLLLYAAALTPLGFIVATVLLSTLVAMVFGARPGRAVAFALVASIPVFLVFTRLLAVPLPVGTVLTGLLTGGP